MLYVYGNNLNAIFMERRLPVQSCTLVYSPNQKTAAQDKTALTVIPLMHHKLFRRPGSAMVTSYQLGIKVDQTLWGL